MLEANGFFIPGEKSFAFGYGPLITDPQGVFDLPEGFSYRIIAVAGDQMTDGFIMPNRADGMAAFPAPNGRVLLICNHELTPDLVTSGPFGVNNSLLGNLPEARIYDRGNQVAPCLGGTTNHLYNPATGFVEEVRLSLAGTQRNCAGGPTPWGTWISCEESTQRATGNYEEPHGYCFEVPARMTDLPIIPQRLDAMGRFNHEAVAVDPRTGIVYQTEDRDDSLIYRFIPTVPGNLAAGGKLQALVVVGQPSLDTRNWVTKNVAVGAKLAVSWVDLTDVHSPTDNLRFQGFNAGAARFARGEGMWEGEGPVFFACTSGGAMQVGQVWKYVPSPNEGTPAEAASPGMLELFIEPNDAGLIDSVDNLTISPWGDLILCEDGGGSDRLVGVTPAGDVYVFGLNANSTSEVAGACFSPDGSTLFVNLHTDGRTLAITGPWRKRFGAENTWVIQ